MTVSPTLIKWGVVGLVLIAAGFYIDHRARAQVHESYRVKHLEEVEARRKKDLYWADERTRIDRENFELVVLLKTGADRANASAGRLRNELEKFRVSCDPNVTPGCQTSGELADLLGRCVEKYRELGERSIGNFAAGKKCETRYDQVEQESKD